MARYTGPQWRINRRENATVVGVSEKWKRRTTAPGQFPKSLKRPTEYAIQFREKQKVKKSYGMLEKQFRRFYAIAQKSEGNTGTRFLQLLELRLDNVLFRLGFAKTRNQARQMVTHGHVLVNGKKHDIPSTIMKAGDEIMIKPSTLTSAAFTQRVSELEAIKAPAWLEKYSTGGKVLSEPTRDMIDPTIKERLIIELYSK